MSHLLSPSLRTIFYVLVQPILLSTFVKYTNTDKSRGDLSCALDFVLQGGVDVAMAHTGKDREGPPHTVGVHECIFVWYWNLIGMGT